MTSGEKIALVIGGLAVAGGVGYLVFSAKKAEAKPIGPTPPPAPPAPPPPSKPAADIGVLAQQQAEEEKAAAAAAAAWELAQQAAQAAGGVAYTPPPAEPLGIPAEWEIPLPALPEGYEYPELPGAWGTEEDSIGLY